MTYDDVIPLSFDRLEVCPLHEVTLSGSTCHTVDGVDMSKELSLESLKWIEVSHQNRVSSPSYRFHTNYETFRHYKPYRRVRDKSNFREKLYNLTFLFYCSWNNHIFIRFSFKQNRNSPKDHFIIYRLRLCSASKAARCQYTRHCQLALCSAEPEWHS